MGSAPISASRRPSQAQTRKNRRKAERSQKRRRDAPLPKHGTAATNSAAGGVGAPKASKSIQPVPDEDDFGGFSDESSDEEEELSNSLSSRATKNKLAEDDAEIAALEKKLGIKQRKTLPKSFLEDGLDEVLGELAEQGDDDALLARRKRKAEADEWLAQKRRKAAQQRAEDSGEEDSGEESDEDDSLAGLELGSDLGDSDDFDDDGAALDLEEEGEEAPVRRRENPYVAPVPAAAAAQKYVPPARRQEGGSDAELVSRIRRQAQGFINRLTESNLIAILGDIEKLYREHPRQHATSVLVDLVLVQICEPTSLPDTLLILHAGFATAVYKVIGSDVGAQLIQQAVERFRGYYAEVPSDASRDVSKQTSNLITFLAQTYNFQLIGCNLIFDYVRFLLDHLSELNAELLLRIVRMAGQNLRHDDPLALKDIVALIRPAVSKIGEANLSVRTKFMIESINDLKNNKVKVGAAASAVNQDYTTRMKKLLGSLNSRKLKATEPLRIGLKDMEESDKRGKWWLVGASWAGRDSAPEEHAKKEETNGGPEVDEDNDEDANSITLDSDEEVVPDLQALAREQNMNTDIRRSIFIAIMSASDYEDAYGRVMKLRLKKGRQKEVAYVVMQCAGAEQQYNPYYSLVARRLCGDGKIRFALQDSLWKLFRRLGETIFGEDAEEEHGDDDDESEGEATSVPRIFCVAKMFGFLVANGAQGLGVLKCLNLRYLRPKTRDMVEVMLITLFQELKVAGSEPTKVFAAVVDIAELSKGLRWFLRKRVCKTDLLTSKKDKKLVKQGCDEAITALATHEERAARGSG
ncbi:putative suppressor of glycerol defect protein 1 [Diaporthe ampelina]|uniref:Putative suppressor of glycerol defect protein 1 n=1 Tax=Diaporthe ampelina TaxID=1214573 RepID=A0A0G2HCH2_9PEZI|nr:putative suppressor of glycerol defect protein 1 [Diaporthe ampelina]